MSTRTRTEVICDKCEAVGEPHDWDETAAWMAAHGWEQQEHRDLCPSCLMDGDAAMRGMTAKAAGR